MKENQNTEWKESWRDDYLLQHYPCKGVKSGAISGVKNHCGPPTVDFYWYQVGFKPLKGGSFFKLIS